ncbi:hypothetical protein [Salininema proteolyticum]|uniref:Uncharacterized protein n=1 Tax=Salininema proteolyticum TaxID=1607685 RepID=A0ABV8U2N8_9ACTN
MSPTAADNLIARAEAEHRPPPTSGPPVPSWWRSAPQAVSDALTELAHFSGNRFPSLHLAVSDYCRVSADVYAQRVRARKWRLRPSASVELEPSRLLSHYFTTSDPVAAYHHCGPDDLRDAVISARAQAEGDNPPAVVRVVCDEDWLEAQAALVTTAQRSGVSRTVPNPLLFPGAADAY